MDTSLMVTKKTRKGIIQYRALNDDIFSIVNTIDKMSQKRSFIAAVLIGYNASSDFTQDVEDMPGFGTADVVDAEFTDVEQKKKPKSNGKPQPEQATEVSWPSKETVAWVMDKFRKQEMFDTEILKLAGVSSFDDGDGWRKYDDAQAAVLHIQATFDAQLDNRETGKVNDGVSNMPDNTEQTETFYWMNYIGSHSNLQFSTNPPHSEHNTYAILYGGRGAIREWGGDALYEQLNLSQFDAIKGKNIVSDFSKMTVPVDFRFVPDGKGDDRYFKIVGIVGDPVIPF